MQGQLRYYTSHRALEPIATVVVSGAALVNLKKPRAGRYAFRLNCVEQEVCSPCAAPGGVRYNNTTGWWPPQDGHSKYVLAGESEEESFEWVCHRRTLGPLSAHARMVVLLGHPPHAARTGRYDLQAGEAVLRVHRPA